MCPFKKIIACFLHVVLLKIAMTMKWGYHFIVMGWCTKCTSDCWNKHLMLVSTVASIVTKFRLVTIVSNFKIFLIFLKKIKILIQEKFMIMLLPTLLDHVTCLIALWSASWCDHVITVAFFQLYGLVLWITQFHM